MDYLIFLSFFIIGRLLAILSLLFLSLFELVLILFLLLFLMLFFELILLRFLDHFFEMIKGLLMQRKSGQVRIIAGKVFIVVKDCWVGKVLLVVYKLEER